MKTSQFLQSTIAAACVLFTACAATAAEPQYPARPVRMIVPFAPGGPTDTMGRILAQKLTEAFGQQVVVDNRAGAGGNIGMGIAANALPDGYTLLIVSSSFVVNPGSVQENSCTIRTRASSRFPTSRHRPTCSWCIPACRRRP